MGLDAHVGEYESPDYIQEHLGSYGGYARWRRAVAEAKGFDLDQMEGFGGKESWEGKPFQLILNHSDHDGKYTLEQIPLVLKEAIEIQKLGVDHYEQSAKFIWLCNAALRLRKPIVFA